MRSSSSRGESPAWLQSSSAALTPAASHGPIPTLTFGLYYREASPVSLDRVRLTAESICVTGSAPVVTEFYGWGPWVNGGAWIQTPSAISIFSIATSIKCNE